jgi:hypothetical protein
MSEEALSDSVRLPLLLLQRPQQPPERLFEISPSWVLIDSIVFGHWSQPVVCVRAPFGAQYSAPKSFL